MATVQDTLAPPEVTHDRQPSPRPGLILSAMAAMSAALIVLPPVGILIFLYQNGALRLEVMLDIGWFFLNTLVPAFPPSRPFMAFIVIPVILLFMVSITYLIAFFRRAAWGPVVVSILAIGWALAASSSTLLVPMLTMPGGLPLLTILGMIPGLVAPVLFALGFVGFLLHADVTRIWFRVARKEPRP
ncbi:MAG: hypothetical protein MUC44_01390 [Beijerinckiaceae bacterium]|jgi:hypothetical protein|nr:hypothetical protein [Beijerinckiaceae bacterium]